MAKEGGGVTHLAYFSNKKILSALKGRGARDEAAPTRSPFAATTFHALLNSFFVFLPLLGLRMCNSRPSTDPNEFNHDESRRLLVLPQVSSGRGMLCVPFGILERHSIARCRILTALLGLSEERI